MRCEVLAVGTELLLGQVVDTNSSWIGEQLAAAGIDSHFQAKVGDNQSRIVTAIRQALARSDAVICCGGLGPTQDDITRESIAEVLGVPLELDEEIAARIEGMFSRRGRGMALNNLRQAEVPKGATVIPQVRGTAPGLVCRLGDRSIYAVPGVPGEMREMVTRAVIPDLVSLSGVQATIASRTLRTWGMAESTVAEVLAPRLVALDAAAGSAAASAAASAAGLAAGSTDASGSGEGATVPTIAFLASGIEGIKVRITAKAATVDEAEAAIRAEEAEVRPLLGQAVFGVNDETMEAAVGALLLERGYTLGVAESLTGGLVGSRLTAVAGASEWFRGSIVAYATEAKRKLLGVGDSPAVSEETALEMAAGAAAALGADVGLSLTGVAGPTEQDGQPVGTVWIGLHTTDGDDRARLLRLAGDRDQIRQIATISALDWLRRTLLDHAES
ncbi:MAG TPA: nicotinamide-nucleotide amidohydrolase family protein [Acidimicrobiales bacterium]|nr:nicotinamide-nucleotide amidohydrolase family protein [Acidimicrobiales bacterium]